MILLKKFSKLVTNASLTMICFLVLYNSSQAQTAYNKNRLPPLEAHTPYRSDCYNIYRQQLNSTYDFSKVIKPCTNEADRNIPIAQLIVGLLYLYGQGVDQDYNRAYLWLDKATRNHQKEAFSYMGDLYMLGNVAGVDTEKSYARAFTYYSEGANLGDSPSMYALSQMYGNGIATKINQRGYLHWLQQAAKAGDAKAQYELGMIYYQGLLLPKSYANTFSLLGLAASQDLPEAQFALGMLYLNGQGIRKNINIAVQLISDAARENYNLAQYQLGYLYERGNGVSRNLSTAKYWYSLSCNAGVKEACVSFQLLVNDKTIPLSE